MAPSNRDGHRAMLPVLVVGLLASLYCWAVVVSTFIKPGSIGLDYIGPGTDWMPMYGATGLALHGHAATALDGERLTEFINKAFAGWLSRPLLYRPFVYPPSAFVVFWPFTSFGFLSSYVAFQLASAVLLAGALLYRAERGWAAPFIAAGALLCPAASVNAVDGQLGFLVAGLLVLGMRLLPVRPFLAGAVLGVLSVKPQFALLVPVILLARWQWAVALGAVASAAALAVVSAAVFGPSVWWDWASQVLGGMNDAQTMWVNTGRVNGSSVYACAMQVGLPSSAASFLQAAATVGAAAAAFVALRSRLGADGKLAVVLACAFLAAPHCSTYDMVLLTAAAGLWFAGQPNPGPVQRLVLLGFWVLPIVGPPNLVPVGRLLPLAVAGFIALVLWPFLARPVRRIRA